MIGLHEGQSTQLNGKMGKRVATGSLLNEFITFAWNIYNVVKIWNHVYPAICISDLIIICSVIAMFWKVEYFLRKKVKDLPDTFNSL